MSNIGTTIIELLASVVDWAKENKGEAISISISALSLVIAVLSWFYEYPGKIPGRVVIQAIILILFLVGFVGVLVWQNSKLTGCLAVCRKSLIGLHIISLAGDIMAFSPHIRCRNGKKLDVSPHQIDFSDSLLEEVRKTLTDASLLTGLFSLFLIVLLWLTLNGSYPKSNPFSTPIESVSNLASPTNTPVVNKLQPTHTPEPNSISNISGEVVKTSTIRSDPDMNNIDFRCRAHKGDKITVVGRNPKGDWVQIIAPTGNGY